MGVHVGVGGLWRSVSVAGQVGERGVDGTWRSVSVAGRVARSVGAGGGSVG